MRPFDLSTESVHGAGGPEPETGSVLQPIFQSTTFARASLGTEPAFSYSRVSNPTVSALESAIAKLEDAPRALCFGTGMAATTTLCLSLLKSGDRVVAGDAVYGGTYRLLNEVLAPLGIRYEFVDTSNLTIVEQALAEPTQLLILESPANPTLKLADIAACSKLAHAAGARVVVDNTFMTPVLQRPLDLGADIVLHSTTKYMDGHNATVGGALITRDEALTDRLAETRKSIGTIQAPFEAWLTIQGLKTLTMRVTRQSDSAFEVARFLDAHPRVVHVDYPFLDTFPQVALARSQQAAGGAIVSFVLDGGYDAGVRLAGALGMCHLAENLGAAETLVTHPASMTHAAMPPEHREAIGLPDGMLRVSVGLERPADIIADLEQAIAASEVPE